MLSGRAVVASSSKDYETTDHPSKYLKTPQGVEPYILVPILT
jgi:hypothetical protein